MSLQLSLVLIGLIILAVVVLGSYDRARLNKRFAQLKRHQVSARGIVHQALSKVERKFRSYARLDINPGPLTETHRKFLRADARPDKPTIKPDVDPFYDDLESIEQAASMPLDVALGLDDIDSDDVAQDDKPAEVKSVAAQQTMPDEAIDFIVALPGPGPVTRDKALGIYKQNEYVMEKPRRLYGLRYIEGVWASLDHDPEQAKYSDLALTVQLVDAKGPIDESELTAFSQLGLKLADALGRPARHAMSFEDALQRARKLDEFCREYDVIASINVVPGGPASFKGRAIEKAALDAGMRFGAMNIFHLKNDRALGCRHMFSMANLYEPGEFDPAVLNTFETKGVSLFMHVPCTYAPEEVFDKMVRTADELCRSLGGKMLDHDKKPLTKKGLAVIHAQIEQITAGMVAEGVVPGSERALRLFAI